MPWRSVLLFLATLALTAAQPASGQEVRRLPPPPELLDQAAAANATPLAAPAGEPAHTPTAADVSLPEPAAPAPEPATPDEDQPQDAPAEPLVADLIPAVGDQQEQLEQVAHWYSPSYWLGPEPWDTGIEFGMNGSSGSGDSLSTRSGGYIKRKTARGKLDTSLFHNRTKSDGNETQNNARLDLRYDWLTSEASPWTLYAMNQSFYDRYQTFDLNVNVNLGVGYQFFDIESVKFGTSFGAGVARKFGGVRDEWVPEAQGGVKWEQSVSDTQRFVAKLDYFPEWQDFNNYRLVTDLGWEIDLNKPSNVSLKFSLADRFDSQSDGVNPHNTNYSVLLLWKK